MNVEGTPKRTSFTYHREIHWYNLKITIHEEKISAIVTLSHF